MSISANNNGIAQVVAANPPQANLQVAVAPVTHAPASNAQNVAQASFGSRLWNYCSNFADRTKTGYHALTQKVKAAKDTVRNIHVDSHTIGQAATDAFHKVVDKTKSGTTTVANYTKEGALSVAHKASAKCKEVAKNTWTSSCGYVDQATTWMDRKVLDLTKKVVGLVVKDDAKCETIARRIRNIIYLLPLAITINCVPWKLTLGIICVGGVVSSLSKRAFQRFHASCFLGFAVDTLRNLAHSTVNPNPISIGATLVGIAVCGVFGWELTRLSAKPTLPPQEAPASTATAQGNTVAPAVVADKPAPSVVLHPEVPTAGTGANVAAHVASTVPPVADKPVVVLQPEVLAAGTNASVSAPVAAIVPAVADKPAVVLQPEVLAAGTNASVSAPVAAIVPAVADKPAPSVVLPPAVPVISNTAPAVLASNTASSMATSSAPSIGVQPVIAASSPAVQSIQAAAPVVAAPAQSEAVAVSSAASSTPAASASPVRPIGRGKGKGKTLAPFSMSLRADKGVKQPAQQ